MSTERRKARRDASGVEMWHDRERGSEERMDDVDAVTRAVLTASRVLVAVSARSSPRSRTA